MAIASALGPSLRARPALRALNHCCRKEWNQQLVMADE